GRFRGGVPETATPLAQRRIRGAPHTVYACGVLAARAGRTLRRLGHGIAWRAGGASPAHLRSRARQATHHMSAPPARTGGMRAGQADATVCPPHDSPWTMTAGPNRTDRSVPQLARRAATGGLRSR